MLSIVAAALGAFFQVSVGAVEPGEADPVKILVSTDRQDALYKCGEMVTFLGAITRQGNPLTTGTATVRISNDGMKTISTMKIDLAARNPFTVEGTMAVPGFLQCEVNLDKDRASAGAGFEPEKIQAAAQAPEDFMDFWNDGIRALDEIPPDARLEPLPNFSTPQFDCFKISFANIDSSRIYGFLSVPKDKQGPFPALVSVPGAGPGHCAPDSHWAKAGVITLLMNVHQYDPPTDAVELQKRYDELNRVQTYSHQGAPDRNQYYFRKSILGINRAINWLAERPDVDKERLAIFGSSQGGAFTLVMAGLNKKIKAASANVPALCDHAGYKLDRNPGWPRLVANDDPERLKMSGYFDAVNFARSITCPILVSAGFIDTTCSPSSVYAAYNIIRAPKMMFNEPEMGHSQSARFSAYRADWLRGKLGLAKETPPLKESFQQGRP
jgi:cephalosporin-C deacetylase-like acetyl esterase